MDIWRISSLRNMDTTGDTVLAPFSTAHSFQSRVTLINLDPGCCPPLPATGTAADPSHARCPPALPYPFHHRPPALNPTFCEQIPSTFLQYYVNIIYYVSMIKFTLQKKRPASRTQKSTRRRPLWQLRIYETINAEHIFVPGMWSL